MRPLITKEQSDRYVKHAGEFCPFCDGDMIEGSTLEMESGVVWQDVQCLSCNAWWQDVYTLTSCDNVHTRDREEENDQAPEVESGH